MGRPFPHDNPGYWVRPESHHRLVEGEIPFHGHIYALREKDQLLCYEFREGELPRNAKVLDPTFRSEFCHYLSLHGLDDILGLQVLDEEGVAVEHIEFEISDQGTILIPMEQSPKHDVYRVTGWRFVLEGRGIVSVKGRESHGLFRGTHVIFTDGKLEDVNAALRFLDQMRSHATQLTSGVEGVRRKIAES